MRISVQYKTVRYQNSSIPWEYSVVNDLPIRLVWYYAWGGLTCSKSVANWTWVEIVAFYHPKVRRFEYGSCSELVHKTAKLSYWTTAFRCCPSFTDTSFVQFTRIYDYLWPPCLAAIKSENVSRISNFVSCLQYSEFVFYVTDDPIAYM